ncbi:putative Ig domain-containing protein [Actinoplanes sp. NPDC049681]|uniref:putative Ig domain-containing protein n=1 Tax=Actinoplanes sp. NPDC049681 TaxID=3363905 RepID=UPI0037A36A6C
MPMDPAVAGAPRRMRASGDGGFSLIEVLMAIAVITTVMTAAAPFLVTSVVATDSQSGQNVAIQLATDALERARALTPSSLLSGRGELAVKKQWTDAPAAVKRHLDKMRIAWGEGLTGSSAGTDAPLPTAAYTVPKQQPTDPTYQQSWYVGKCWQAKLTSAATPDPSTGAVPVGECTAPADPSVIPTGPEFVRVLVAVTWTQRRPCPENACVYVASMLASVGADPTFDVKQPAPVIKDPADQTNYTDDAVSLQMTVTGGTLPLKWSATGLPNGLSINPDTGLITGTPSAGSYPTVEITVSDSELPQKRSDKSTFGWTVIQAPMLINPGDQQTRPSTPVNLAMAGAGGKQPVKWSATGLPAGLTINATTGVISGTTSAAVQAYSTTVTMTDAGTPARAVSVSFVWRVAIPLTLYNPGQQTMTIDDYIDYTLVATGGTAPYTWQGQNLPGGLSINAATGRVTGTVTNGSRYITTITVTDKTGATATMDVVCIVDNRTGADLRVTVPDPTTNPDRSTPVNTTITSFTADSSGANPPSHTWTATGLPPGVTISSGGTVSGKPTVKGKYTVTLIVTSAVPDTAKLMFVWTVT